MRVVGMACPIAFAPLAVLTTCGGGSDGPSGLPDPGDPPGATTASIVVLPDAQTLEALGATVNLDAEAREADGTAIPGVAFVWESSDSEVATVDANGLVTAVGNGPATITASAEGHSGDASIIVAQVVADEHSSVSAEPTSAPADGTSPVEVVITLKDGNEHPIADRAVAIEISGSGNMIAQPPPTDADGRTTGSFSSDIHGTKTVTVRVDPANANLVLSHAVEVEFTYFVLEGHCPDADGDGACESIVCDGGIAIDDADPVKAAHALGICRSVVDETDFGLIDVAYARADGSSMDHSLQMGILDAFGPNVPPLEGNALLALSTGRARTKTDPNPCGSDTCAGSGEGTAPTGFPQDLENCLVTQVIRDDVAILVRLRAPSNAQGLAFRSKFYTFEYPNWVCTIYNDQFVVLMDPAPAGAIGGNVALDENGDPITVNVSFLDVCEGCALGTAELALTGFDSWGNGTNPAGATGWLRTTVPVEGGQEFTLRFIIWDAGDTTLDSTVLLDGFEWLITDVTVTTSTSP